jgi:uncharacterized protein
MLGRAPHLHAFLLMLFVLLYGGAPTHASVTVPAGARGATGGAHIALLLPTGSAALAQAAEAVREGFEEGVRKLATPLLPVIVYSVADDPQQLTAAYRDALTRGAHMVVGPLTRAGVATLAQSDLVKVPTLALNVPEKPGPAAPQLFMLSLQVENEARQVARLALREGRRRALSVTEETPLGRRMRDAFVEEFERGGGFGIADYAYSTTPTELARLKQAAHLGVADMVFLALEAKRAHAVRPHLGTLVVYGTSHLNPGPDAAAAHADLAEVRFVDMPWMVDPGHPTVLAYERPPYGGYELQRLYALGIDAARLAPELLAGARDITMEGVTGQLKLGPDRQFVRTLVPATLSAGRLNVVRDAKQ